MIGGEIPANYKTKPSLSFMLPVLVFADSILTVNKTNIYV